MKILKTENLNFRYPASEKYALTNINIEIDSGEFIVMCGESGCGKTTLLKLLKREISPFGEKSGKIFYNNSLIDDISENISASEIGFVMQNPESQIVTDKVWHELCFGLENLGIDSDIIRRRTAEMANYFGIQDWFRQNTDELSGGQKQLLNLASVMVMQPKILILDEPTSQLDPIAASEFIATLQKLNRELGLTIILAEHRLEEVFPVADRVIVMEEGKILLFDTPRNIGKLLPDEHKMFNGLPTSIKIFKNLNIEDECPLTVKEGRKFLQKYFRGNNNIQIPQPARNESVAINLKNIWFRYEKDGNDVLRDIQAEIYKGEIFSILGGNGTGKSTALKVISGIEKPYKGKITINGKTINEYKNKSLYFKNLALLPQNPQNLFLKETVYEDFIHLLDSLEYAKENQDKHIDAIAQRLGIVDLLSRHPYDLSGGEQQKCAIAKLLLTEPKILLLDEPTKGLDSSSKLELSMIFKELKAHGVTIVFVTHDVEFAAENSDRCALFFDGEILSASSPEKFFSENNFYTTAANRMARELFPNAVTYRQVIESCRSQIQ